jgi:putative transposase
MPRIARMIIPNEQAVYHVMSRTALDGFPFGDVEKDHMVQLIQKFSKLYFVEILGYCIMGNHYHILARMFPGNDFSDQDIKQRYINFYGKDRDFSDEQIPYCREKWSSLSEFIKEIKQRFTFFYNKRHKRRGTLWGDRFKSVIVENGETLVNCLAYIDLNPIRAGIVKRPEDYRWSSIGYHIQTCNKNNFLSLDFGLREFGEMDDVERLRRYRRYVYEAGALKSSEKEYADTIDEATLEKERKNEFKLTRVQRFRYRTRYFSDSGIIGTKAFVLRNYQRFKDIYYTKKEKLPKPISGLEGIYSLKRLAE